MRGNIITNTVLPALSGGFLNPAQDKQKPSKAEVRIEDGDFAIA